jgi:hypothetical protein
MAGPSFPFVGAGDASYFEWAEMFVCFERKPADKEAAVVAKRVPVPLRDTIEWTDRLLWVASEQGVGRVIKAAYKKSPAAPSQLTSNNRFAMAPSNAYARFNADIDACVQQSLVRRRSELHDRGAHGSRRCHRDARRRREPGLRTAWNRRLRLWIHHAAV